MLNIRKLIFVSVFILFAFAVIGCDRNGVNLPEDDAAAIKEILRGEEFLSFVVWDSNTRETVKFNRTEKDKKGEPLYTTRRISGPIPVENIEGVTSYSVVGCVLNGNDQSCNLIKIDGQEEVLVCKKNGEAEPLSSEVVTNATNEIKAVQLASGKAEFGPMPSELVDNLKKLVGNTIKELGFSIVTVDNSENQRIILLLSEDYETVPVANTDLLESISTIKDNIIASTLVAYKQNPCCITEVLNGAAVETCYKKC